MGTVLKIGRGEPRILLISSSLVSENSPSLNPSVDPTLSGVPRSLPSLPPTIIQVYASATGNGNLGILKTGLIRPRRNARR